MSEKKTENRGKKRDGKSSGKKAKIAKKSGKKKVIKIGENMKCPDCGKIFVRSGKATKRCPECAKAHHNLMKKKYRHKYEESMTRPDQSLAHIGSEPLKKPAVSPHPGRCLFCGKPIKETKMFCTRCVFEGFDNVYLMAGKTNGWDKEIKSKVEAQAGWRGHAVVGGYTQKSPISI